MTHLTHTSVTHHVLDVELVHDLSFVHTAFGVSCNTHARTHALETLDGRDSK